MHGHHQAQVLGILQKESSSQRMRESERETGREVEVALKVLLGVVFAGWMMMWVVMPTNTYRKNWLLKIRSATNSTYFGRAGANLLIFSFPILFISVLGCAYLYLEQKRNKQTGMKCVTKNNQRLAFWKRPLLIKGPLGVVSSVELAFSLMFLALLVWCFSIFLHVSFSRITTPKHGELLWEAKLDSAALRLGLVGNICLAFLFFPVTRGSSLLPLVGLISESSVRYHVWIGHIVMVLLTAHGILYVIYWAATDQIFEMINWAKAGVSNVAGELAQVFGLAMWVTTIPSIRRKAFEVFFYTHQLYVLFLLFYILHVGVSYFFYVLPGIYLFILDRYLRFLQSRTCTCLLNARVLPTTIELTFSKSPGFDYKAMSTIFMNIPSISKLQWHLFTVSTSSTLEPEKMSVVIKIKGKWTQKLYQMLSSNSPPDRLEVSLEGPYGPTADHFLKYGSLVLVSGGSGITPFIALIRELLHVAAAAPNANIPTPAVHLICAFKASADLTMLDLLLPISREYSSDLSRLHLHIDAFVTQEKDTTAAAATKMQVRTIWFKPSTSDAPIIPVLGPNSWLWLAAVICSSFVAFLILIGIINRYYIYPIDKNTKKIYSYSSKSMLTLLVMCICIGAAGGAAMLCNRKRAVLEARQVQCVDGPTPAASPSGAWVGGADRELESLPGESLVQATTVQFGTRPNLKKMLLECEEENTGVFVSGPSAMRRQVAAVCGSGLADNLHFESVSFSW